MIIVTLSAELLGHLRGLAGALEVPLEWLVAGIVCDTFETPAQAGPPSAGQLVASWSGIRSWSLLGFVSLQVFTHALGGYNASFRKQVCL
jgi:hypothetical protein